MSWMWPEVSVPSVVCLQEMYLFIWHAGKNYDVSAELQEIQATVDKAAAQKLSFFKAFKTKEAKKGLMVAFGLMIFQQLSGINAVIFYTTDIFKVSITWIARVSVPFPVNLQIVDTGSKKNLGT